MSRPRVSPELRREIWERARGCCEYCQAEERFSPVSFHCEHIIAVQHGGESVAANLALSCPACNFRKGTNLTAIDPDTAAVIPLFNPRHDPWAGHFEHQYPRIAAKTATGRATIRLLDLNSPQRVASREFERQIQRT